MRFDASPELADLRRRVRAFVDQHIIPAEAELIAEDRVGQRTRLTALQDQVRALGLWTPHLPVALGGLGLGPMGMSTLFREMGRSLLGARVFNCDAPDQGNMDLLQSAGSFAQKQRWLRPLCQGEITSGFSMTEPAPGAGSDPSNLRTTARPVPASDGGGWVIDGRKWYTTGGGQAAFLIVMARTSDDPRRGATLFLVDRHAPGVEHVRDIDTLAEPLLAHREAELVFHGVRVREEDVLGQVGDGFVLAQKRLVPARLTHCMRWLGLCDRTLQSCKQHLTTRQAFGQVLAAHQQIQVMVAEHASAIHAGNLMTFHCAWLLEQGREREARTYSSMCKLHVARLLCRLLDDAIQMHGSLGFSRDVPYGDWYRHARSARIADGPDEVHVMVIARDYLSREVELLV
jgi:acyl-CoA dehydrogenase